MKIIPKRGLNIGTGTAPIHAPAGVAVEVSDSLGLSLLALDAASRAPADAPVAPASIPAAPAVEKAVAAPSALVETAAVVVGGGFKTLSSRRK